MTDDDQPRRRYDDSVPAIEYVEEKLLRAFEVGLRETRHALKQDIAALSATVGTNALKATEEHADVRSDLNNLRRDIVELKPLRERVDKLQESDRTDHAVTDALTQNRIQTEKNRVQIRTWALAIITAIITASGVIVAVLALFVT